MFKDLQWMAEEPPTPVGMHTMLYAKAITPFCKFEVLKRGSGEYWYWYMEGMCGNHCKTMEGAQASANKWWLNNLKACLK